MGTSVGILGQMVTNFYKICFVFVDVYICRYLSGVLRPNKRARRNRSKRTTMGAIVLSQVKHNRCSLHNVGVMQNDHASVCYVMCACNLETASQSKWSTCLHC